MPLVAATAGALKGNRTLAKAFAVRSEEEVTEPAPRGLTEGVYFLTADVQPNPGFSTWAVSEEWLETGGGVIYGIGPAARAASDLGVDVDPSMWGLTEQSDGFSESVECAERAG